MKNFNWKEAAAAIMVAAILFLFVWTNTTIFPDDSIWSWTYWYNKAF